MSTPYPEPAGLALLHGHPCDLHVLLPEGLGGILPGQSLLVTGLFADQQVEPASQLWQEGEAPSPGLEPEEDPLEKILGALHGLESTPLVGHIVAVFE